MIKAVIFDMDGVLIDSEIVYLRHHCRLFHEKYPWVNEENLIPIIGMSEAEFTAYLAQLLHRDAQDPDFLEELKTVIKTCQVNYRDIMRPQVPSLLEQLQKQGLQIALASSSSPENIARVLSECGITRYFESIISGDQFAQSKPDPEIYLHTMKVLGRRPQECLVIEDSTYGVQAGAASGAVVAALRDDRFPFDQHLAALQIGSLNEIPDVIKRYENK